jgi:hypothetical protein
MAQVMLTTTDNPFDPFDDWERWFAFDQSKNNLVHTYFNADSCQVLAKYSLDTTELPPDYALVFDEFAIDKICEMFKELNVFKKVKRD